MRLSGASSWGIGDRGQGLGSGVATLSLLQLQLPCPLSPKSYPLITGRA